MYETKAATESLLCHHKLQGHLEMLSDNVCWFNWAVRFRGLFTGGGRALTRDRERGCAKANVDSANTASERAVQAHQSSGYLAAGVRAGVAAWAAHKCPLCSGLFPGTHGTEGTVTSPTADRDIATGVLQPILSSRFLGHNPWRCCCTVLCHGGWLSRVRVLMEPVVQSAPRSLRGKYPTAPRGWRVTVQSKLDQP